MAVEFNIGEGLNKIEAYKSALAKKRIVGGVYNAATVGGFRDFNLYNNYIRFENRELGRRYVLPTGIGSITRSAFGETDTVLSDVGGLEGYTHDRYFLSNALNLNVREIGLINSMTNKAIPYSLIDYAKMYVKFDAPHNNSADSNIPRYTRLTQGLNEYTANLVYVDDSTLVDDQNNAEVNKRGFKDYSEKNEVSRGNGILESGEFLDGYVWGYRENSFIYNGLKGMEDSYRASLLAKNPFRATSLQSYKGRKEDNVSFTNEIINSLLIVADWKTKSNGDGLSYYVKKDDTVTDLYSYYDKPNSGREFYGSGLFYYSGKYWDEQFNNRNTFVNESEHRDYGVERSKTGRVAGVVIGDIPTKEKDFNFRTETFNKGTAYESNYTAYDEYSRSGNGSTNLYSQETNKILDGEDSNSIIGNTQRGYEGTISGHTVRQYDSLINRFHTKSPDQFENGQKQFETSLTKKFGFSRGRNLLTKDAYENGVPQPASENGGYDNPYCRVWTQRHQYAKLKDRIRPFVGEKGSAISLGDLHKQMFNDESKRILRPHNGSERLGAYSVLQDNGYVRIAPKSDASGNFDNIKKYMFSIENLAWRDVNLNAMLAHDQIGPNDGRIMWFPPYNLKFSDNANVEWNANQFIGRGEKIYTYTDTERHGTLSFTLLIDHPSIVNEWKLNFRGEVDDSVYYEKEQELLRFFAGCGPLESTRGKGKIKQPVSPNNNEAKVEIDDSKDPELTPYRREYNYVMFFPNNYSGKNELRNDEIVSTLFAYDSETNFYSDVAYKKQILAEKNIKDVPWSEALNSTTAWSESLKSEIIKKLGLEDKEEFVFPLAQMKEDLETEGRLRGEDIRIVKITCKGNASKHGYQNTHNHTLAKDRAGTANKLVKLWGNSINYNETQVSIIKGNPNVDTEDTPATEDVNKLPPRIGRSAIVTFEVETVNNNTPSADSGMESRIYTEQNKIEEDHYSGGALEAAIVYAEGPNPNMHMNEYEYFKTLKDTDNLVYSNIAKKVQYFNPAFHSITPEGFNARLTFLHQCTRQGPTKAIDEEGSSRAGNLSFGRAPYCILRIGDFFHSKILIDSLTIDFDGGAGGIQYDLNPEGIGVQPMMANINISFKFIGGQDIAKPIERLQNAVSFNYYANSSIYDKRADYYAAPTNGGDETSGFTPGQRVTFNRTSIEKEDNSEE